MAAPSSGLLPVQRHPLHRAATPSRPGHYPDASSLDRGQLTPPVGAWMSCRDTACLLRFTRMEAGVGGSEGVGCLAEQLRSLRVAAGLSQEELAERAHLSSDAVGALERGIRTRP